MEYNIIEVGSTNTKVYYCKDKELLNYKLYTIQFKKNYKSNNALLESDMAELCDIVNSLEIEKNNIHIYGTSVFRDLKEQEKEPFLNYFYNKTGCKFNIVSAEMENKFTVKGVISDINYNGKLAVMIGGGASTEIAEINNKEIVKMYNQNFGVSNILEKYPDISEDKPISDFYEVLNYTKSLIKDLCFKADILVLAGGDYLKFYETLGTEMNENSFYKDKKQPYIIDKSLMDEIDLKFYHNISLDEIREKDLENKAWWSGTRGMRFCVKAIFDEIDAKYIVPTRISMLYGIMNEIMG
jgi:uncharacterized protein (DUF433 family)